MSKRHLAVLLATASLTLAAPAAAADFVTNFGDLGTEGFNNIGYYFLDGHSASQTFLTGLTSVNWITLGLTGGPDGMYASESITFAFLLNGTNIGSTTYNPGDSATRLLNFAFGPISSGGGSYDLLATVTDGVCIGCGAIQFSTDNPLTFIASTDSAVPEPATWAMMLLGFGLVGGALRSVRRGPKVSVSYT